ncbi:MAG: hypothetical protein IT307_02185 [Chloroflexi bacterium]|nr:hypothetical protein [Chloroflexota bacterium]
MSGSHRRGSALATKEDSTTLIVGGNGHEFELADGWEQLPAGWTHDDVAGVAVDSRDRVYVFNRDEHPVIVYDREGRLLGS